MEEKTICTLEEEAQKELLDTLESARERSGNNFDVAEYADLIRTTLKGKKANKLYLGFDSATYDAHVVVETESGYEFVKLPQVTLVGGVWSLHVFLRLYYAQATLSYFLAELGEWLNIEVEDRCLYLQWLASDLTFDKECIDRLEYLNLYGFCTQIQADFRSQHEAAIEKMKSYKDYWEYINQGFEYRYKLNRIVDDAINNIYANREEFEKNNFWSEARQMIDELRDIRKK